MSCFHSIIVPLDDRVLIKFPPPTFPRILLFLKKGNGVSQMRGGRGGIFPNFLHGYGASSVFRISSSIHWRTRKSMPEDIISLRKRVFYL